jgi:hypothetical protein
VFFEDASLCEYDLAHVGDHAFLYLHVDFQLYVLQF